MYAPSRRRERRLDVLDLLKDKGFHIDKIIDYTSYETSNQFLESTGSFILDRENRKAYCSLSPRADKELFIKFCEDFNFKPFVFTAYQPYNETRQPIYHTNVMMAIGETFAVICLDSIDDNEERKTVKSELLADGKEIIEVTETQLAQFAGNMLQVKSQNDERYLVMSTAAFQSLTKDQLASIKTHCDIIHSDLSLIETCGGGSARCMMAEVFLPRK